MGKQSVETRTDRTGRGGGVFGCFTSFSSAFPLLYTWDLRGHLHSWMGLNVVIQVWWEMDRHRLYRHSWHKIT